MSNEKFTQGEWLAFSDEERRFFGSVDITTYSVSTEKSEVASSVYLEPNGMDLDEAYANANLIAAAPEMYRELKALMEHLEQEDGLLATRIDNLLTKARGE